MANHYRLLSDKNRIVVVRTLPERGIIYDSSGIPLAINKSSYSVVLDFSELNQETVQDDISYLIEKASLDQETVSKIQEIISDGNFKNKSVLIQDNLDWEELSFFSSVATEIDGLYIKKSSSRFYMYPEIFSHVIGYIGVPTQSDIENSQNSALQIPTAKIGKTCVEKEYDDVLFGRVGLKQIEVNAMRKHIKTLGEIESIPGKSVHLTINKDLQEKVYELLSQHKSAACIIMNVNTGEILSFVSYPGYNTNIFNSKIDKNTLSDMYSNPYKPMINKAISGLYSPGSTFKIITALAGLNSGIINKYTTFDCSGCYELGRHKFYCWISKYGEHGILDLRQSIERSCDVFFYNIAKLINPDVVAKVAGEFGLGAKTGIDLPGEKAGLIPTKVWKKLSKNQAWTTGDTFNMCIGQGFVLVTVIQLVTMLSTMVNGLNPVVPHIVKRDVKLMGKKLNYRKLHVEQIKDGMVRVVNGPFGSARMFAIDDDSFLMAGKTGSSQVCRITEKQRKEGKTISKDYWKKEHAFFIGYAPVDDPEFAICVFVEHGGSGGKVAAPIAKEVFLAAKSILVDKKKSPWKNYLMTREFLDSVCLH